MASSTYDGPRADLGVIGFEMVRLVKAAGDILTPALRAALGSTW